MKNRWINWLKWIVGTFFISVVGLLADWDGFVEKVNEIQSGAVAIPSAIIEWLFGSISLPILIFFLLMILAIVGALDLTRKMLTRILAKGELTPAPKNEWELFRNLCFETMINNGKLTVINRNLDDAVCGIGSCEKPIKSKDIIKRGNEVMYLVCQQGHKVGNEIEYEIYEKQRLAKIAEQERLMEEARKEREIADKAAREAFIAKHGRPPAPNFDAGAGYPSNRGGRISRSDEQLAAEFYERLVQEFEYEQNRRTPGKAARMANDLIIDAAVFSAGDEWREVKNKLNASIKNGKLKYYVHIKNLGDPLPNSPKTLKITYSFQGITHTKTYSEEETVDIP